MKEKETLGGLHHVTAIAGAPEANRSFYVGTLGLRLVKKTVNFDDPGTYHLYYGVGDGRPGSIITFFPWTYAARGRPGTGSVAATAFEVAAESLERWAEHLAACGVTISERSERFGEEVLSFADPDGLPLELIGTDRARPASARQAAKPAIRGLRSVTLDVHPHDDTLRLLTDVLGFSVAGESDRRLRLRSGRAAGADVVDLLKTAAVRRGRSGAGTIHHIAFRVASEEEQLSWKTRLEAAGRRVTPVRNRQYFKSVYFREPGGVLFEIATDSPGFTLDEAPAELGTSLKLPPWLEPRRQQIEARLQKLPSPAS